MKYNLSFAFIPSSHMDTPEHKKEIIQTKTNPEKLSSNTFVQKHGINMETTVTLVSGNNTFFAKMKKEISTMFLTMYRRTKIKENWTHRFTNIVASGEAPKLKTRYERGTLRNKTMDTKTW